MGWKDKLRGIWYGKVWQGFRACSRIWCFGFHWSDLWKLTISTLRPPVIIFETVYAPHPHPFTLFTEFQRQNAIGTYAIAKITLSKFEYQTFDIPIFLTFNVLIILKNFWRSDPSMLWFSTFRPPPSIMCCSHSFNGKNTKWNTWSNCL